MQILLNLTFGAFSLMVIIFAIYYFIILCEQNYKLRHPIENDEDDEEYYSEDEENAFNQGYYSGINFMNPENYKSLKEPNLYSLTENPLFHSAWEDGFKEAQKDYDQTSH